jgi:hypothetical protein
MDSRGKGDLAHNIARFLNDVFVIRITILNRIADQFLHVKAEGLLISFQLVSAARELFYPQSQTPRQFNELLHLWRDRAISRGQPFTYPAVAARLCRNPVFRLIFWRLDSTWVSV